MAAAAVVGRLPTLIFVNKIDRVGARGDDLVAYVARLVTPHVVPLGVVGGLGTPAAEFIAYGLGDPGFQAALAAVLAEHDDAVLADLVEDVTPPPARLRSALQAQTAAALVYPLVFGCALSGAGVAALADGIRRLLPPAPAPEDRLRGRVFAIERGAGGTRSPTSARTVGTWARASASPSTAASPTAGSVASAAKSARCTW